MLDPEKEQGWILYTISMLIFSMVTMVFTYVILRLQNILPLNPQQLPAVTDALAFNTAASFTTNTNWQNYGGESTMSYLSQMLALASHNFFSAAVGIALAAAVVRGIARYSAKTLGNFWVDLVRINYYLLLPICIIYALFLVSQGVVQNFKPYDTAKVVEVQTVQVPKKDDKGNPVNDAKGNPVMVDQKVDSQSIVRGPVASKIAIKMLGTNGGGYMNANAAHPFENPTPAVKLYPNPIHFLDRERTDLLPRADGEESETRLGGLDNNGIALRQGGGAGLLGGGSGRKPDRAQIRSRSRRRQHGG